MPQCCVVPLCSSTTLGHRFPRDEKLQKKWIIAIRRDKFKPTINSRICKQHFTESDYVMPQESFVMNRKYLSILYSLQNILLTSS